jgi:hypothetical protein
MLPTTMYSNNVILARQFIIPVITQKSRPSHIHTVFIFEQSYLFVQSHFTVI